MKTAVSWGRAGRRARPLQRRLAATGIVTILAMLLSLFPQIAGLPVPTASAHNLDSGFVYMFFDPATQAAFDAFIASNPPGTPLLQDDQTVGIIIKVVPSDGTNTGVGGYVDFYVPNGVQVTDVAYLVPNGSGGYDKAPIKGQSPIAIGDGPVGTNCTAALGAAPPLTLGPNIIGTTAQAVATTTGCHNGTIAGVYADTGIFFSTDPRTAHGSYSGGALKNNSGDTVGLRTSLATVPNLWDAQQLAAYGIAGSANLAFPSSPIVDPNGRGNAPWGNANAVAGPQSGYAWEFNKTYWDGSAKDAAAMKAASSFVGPWQRVQYPGSQIAKDQPGLKSTLLGYAGVDGSQVGYPLASFGGGSTPLPATTSQLDATSPKTIRWAVGQLTYLKPEYVWVQFKVIDRSQLATANGSACPIFYGDTFGGDAGGTDSGKDHIWRYYDPNGIVWNACLGGGKPDNVPAVKVGDIYQYKIKVYNYGLIPLSNVTVSDLLPSGVAFISAVPAQNLGPNPLKWTVGAIPVGGKFEATVTVKATGTGVLTNALLITSNQGSQTIYEQTPSGAIPILNQSKSVDPAAIAPGGTVTYTIVSKNIGTGPTSSPIKITEYLPSGFSYTGLVSVTANGASYLPTTTVNATNPNQPVFTVPTSIQAGKELRLVFTATVGSMPGSYCNSYQLLEGSTPYTTGALACVNIGGNAVSDFIWRDWNGDGVQDPGEEGIAGVQVCANPGNICTTTDANGHYLINGLTDGTYTISVTNPPAGYTPSYDLDGTGTLNTTQVTLSGDVVRTDVDFGYQPAGSGSIGDQLFEDVNNNHVEGATEPPITAEVTVWLYEDTNGNGVIDTGDLLVDTTTTNPADGAYSFTGLATDVNYLVKVDETDPDLAAYFSPNAFLNTTGAVQAVSPQDFIDSSNNYVGADFGYFALVPSSIGDEVCIDSDGDGSCLGEELLPGVTVNLYLDGELLATTTTSITGTYSFEGLGPGDYTVVVDTTDPNIPGGFFPSVNNIPVSLGVGEDRTDIDFPFVQLISKQVDKIKVDDTGETLTYSIVAQYPGSELLSNVVVTDTTPAGTTYAGNDSPSAASEPSIGGTGTVQWNLGSNVAGTPGVGSSGYVCVESTTIVASQDMYIDKENATSVQNQDRLSTRYDSGNANRRKRSLLQFSLASIPADSTIVGANFNIRVQANANSGHTVDLFRVTNPWIDTQTTWNNRQTATAWTTAGGDYNATVYGTFVPDTNGQWESVDIKSLVEGWYNNTFTNNGLIMVPRESGASADVEYNSTADAGQEPYIEVFYEVVREGGCTTTTTTFNNTGNTYIAAASPTTNFNGAGIYYTQGSPEERMLIDFDLSSIPSNATVTGATLKLRTSSDTVGVHSTEVKALNTAWSQSTATWNSPWTTPGGDFGGTVYATFTPPSGNNVSFDVTLSMALVQSWVDNAAANHGVILDPVGTTGQVSYRTNEAALEVTYVTPDVTVNVLPSQDMFIDKEQATTVQNQDKLSTRYDSGNTNRRKRSLLQFDLASAIPSGATLVSADFNIRVQANANAGHTVDLFRVTNPWIDTQTTWNNRQTATAWTTAGGDYNATVYGTFVPDTNGLYETVDVTTLVDGWLNNTFTNNGLILVPRESGANADVEYNSSADAGQEPYIQLTYTAPSAGGGAVTTLSATPSLVSNGGQIQVTMQITSTSAITDITASNPITVAGTNSASAICGAPTLTSADDDISGASDSVTYTYSCTANTSGVTGLSSSLVFTATGSNTNGDNFAAGTSNSVLAAPPLTFQVQVVQPATVDPVVNKAWIKSASVIPPTPSNPVETALSASIGDYVWADLDGDGTDNGGTEPPLEGVEVCAYDSLGNLVACDITDANGEYRIYGLDDAQDYTVKVTLATLPADYHLTTPGTLTVTSAQLTADPFYANADFGARPPGDASIGDTVWIDANEDGIVDPGETPLPGITLYLYDSTGANLLATTTTDASGVYTFTGLYQGNYIVQVDETSVVTTTLGVTTTLAAAMSLVSGSNPLSVNVPTDTSVVDTADFGYNWSGSIGDYVWWDADAEGDQDEGVPVVGAVVLLYVDADNNGLLEPWNGDYQIGIDFTDANGAYLFDNLPPGNYLVDVYEDSLVTGGVRDVVPTTPDVRAVSLAAGQDIDTADFGYYQGARVEGNVFWDADRNGIFDGGESGLTPVTVTLTGTDMFGAPITKTVETDASGHFVFIVPEGNYTLTYDMLDVAAIDPSLGDQTTPVTYTFHAYPGEDWHPSFDFGVDNTGVIGDTVWNDANNNGSQDPGEPGLAGVTVMLYQDNNNDNVLDADDDFLAAAVTDANGKYLFEGLPDGNYLVVINAATAPADFGQTYDNTGPLDGAGQADISGGVPVDTVDFGYRYAPVVPASLYTIGGRVYNDANSNGSDDSEGGFAGVEVTVVCQLGSAPASTYIVPTDLDGYWAVAGIAGGSICTVLDADESDLPRTDFVPTETPGTPITVNSDTGGLDFGYYQTPGSISGTVCLGGSNGLCDDPGELPLADAVVALTWAGADGILGTGDDITYLTQTTLADGAYNFTALQPGLYSLTQTNPAGYASLDDADGGNPDNITVFSLGLGQNLPGQDFIEAVPVLLMDKDTSTPTVVAGEQATYQVVVRNTGSSVATAVTISDTLPTGFSYASTTSAAVISATRAITVNPVAGATTPAWGAWDIAAGGAVTLTFVADVSAGTTPGTYDNTAYARASNHALIDDLGAQALDGDTLPADTPETDEDVTVEGLPVLLMDKDTNTPTVVAGGQATYQIVVRNSGATVATAVTISDTLPAGFSYASTTSVVTSNATQPSTATPAAGATTPAWGNWNINAGGAVTLTFVANVSAGVMPGTYDNTAYARASNHALVDDLGEQAGDSDTLPGDTPESDEDVTVLGLPALKLDKDTSTPIVVAGEQATYQVVVRNSGGSVATAVTISDTLPAGFSYASTTGAAVSNATRTSTVNPALGATTPAWGNWSINAGGAVTLTFVADVSAGVTPGTYDNTAYARASNHALIDDLGEQAGDSDTLLGDTPESDEDVTILARPALLLDKDTSTPTVEAGGQATYQIVVHNSGTAAATGVTISDTLPAGFTYASTSSAIVTGGTRTSTVNPAAGATTPAWGTWDINAGGAVTLTFAATVGAGVAPGQYDNTATADAANHALINDEGAQANDPGTLSTDTPETDEDVTVLAPPALLMDKDTSTPTVEVGGQAIYQIVVRNTGGAAATGVTISDTLPAGFTYASTSSAIVTGGTRTSTVNPAAGATTPTWGTWNINAGGAVTLTFAANVAVGAAPGQYDNTATADATNHALINDEGAQANDPGTLSTDTPETDEDVTLVAPGIAVDKSGPAVSYVGATASYAYTVTNTGGVPLSGVTVMDDKCGAATFISGDTNTNGLLDLTEAWRFTCAYVVPAGASDPLVNVATAQGISPLGRQVTAADNWTTDLVQFRIGDTVWVDADGDTTPDPGEQRLYNVPVTITGADINGGAVNLTVYTDINGLYVANLALPGVYTVTVQPVWAGFQLTSPLSGSYTGITLTTAAPETMTADFGYGQPTGVYVLGFRGGAAETGIRVSWQVFLAEGIVAPTFDIYRTAPGAAAALKLTTDGPVGPSSLDGNPLDYAFVDAGAQRGISYWYELVNPQAPEVRYGPFAVTIRQVFLPLLRH